MLHTRSLLLTASLALLTGCGARTTAEDYLVDAAVISPDVLPDVRPDVRPDVQPDIPPTCPPGTVLCSGICTNIQSDVSNCGRCGQSCGTSSSVACVNGTCVGVACPAGWTPCSGTCVDLTSDASNCGSCGRICPLATACFRGDCFCPTGQTICREGCVSLETDPLNCGACGRLCPDGSTCSGGVCLPPECPPPLLSCNGACVDISSDPSNCGACGLVCRPGVICTGGRCEAPVCVAPTTRCGDACVNLGTDPMNCGACGRGCVAGQRCSAGVCTAMTMTGTPFQITALTSSSCRTIEHSMPTGDDRGGIAIGSNRVFYTGDTATVAFDLDTLAVTAVGTQRFDGIFGVTLPGLAFTLGSNRVALDERTSIVDTILGVSPSATLGAALLPLSSPVFLDRSVADGGVGIFGGVDRVIITANSRAWIIENTMPVVTELAIAPITEFQRCESWAYWGVAEFFEGAPWVAYVRNSTTISRRNLVTGETRTVATFTNLSDMCSFTVSPARGRWYFHHEGGSQFRSGDETLGYCDARFTR